MAESTSSAVATTAVPERSDIKRAEAFARESFVHEGEETSVALAPGSARRRAFDRALQEIAEGLDYPSPQWRRDFSLLLGLERLLSQEEPKLADGTVLPAHQVDALSGTLTALLAEAQRNGNGDGPGGAASPDLLASADILGPDEGDEASNGAATAVAEPAADTQDEDEDEDDEDEDDEDDDFEDEDEDDEDDDDLEPVQRAAPDADEDDEE